MPKASASSESVASSTPGSEGPVRAPSVEFTCGRYITEPKDALPRRGAGRHAVARRNIRAQVKDRAVAKVPIHGKRGIAFKRELAAAPVSRQVRHDLQSAQL